MKTTSKNRIGENMKRTTHGLVAIALALLVAGTAFAYIGTYVPGSGINGTPHDLGTVHNGMNYTASPADPVGGRICIFCHAPHNSYKLSVANGGPASGGGAAPQAIDAFTYLPLWNHTLPTVLPTYQMYDNGPGAPQLGPKASQAIEEGMAAPGGVSLLCLSCHDGSIAVNSYGNTAQPLSARSTGTTTIAPSYQVGAQTGGVSFLGNHHPIGFDYDAAQGFDIEINSADAGFLTPTTTVRDHLFGTALNPGDNKTLECASCHSVHNTGNSGESLLWRSDQNSALCLTCHAKGQYTSP
jgi:predicted CXXCH cytochrome family protein